MSITTWWMRRGMKKGDAKRDAGLTTPEDIFRVDDISYGSHKMNVLDVYRPKNIKGKLPVIVSVHGGGWVYGDKELYQHYCMSLAQRGFAVINFTYRLSPEHKFPVHLEDTVKVFKWMLKHAKEYEFDVDNVFAVGDSAGGHILSLFCILCSNPEYAAKYQFKVPEGFIPKAVALNCGVYDMSPVNFITAKFPPCYVMTSNQDFLKEQAPLLLEKLDAAGVCYKYKLYGDEEHPLYHVFHLDMRNEIGKQCNDEECAFFATIQNKGDFFSKKQFCE